MHVNAGAHWSLEEVCPNPLELEFGMVLSQLLWVLGAKLRSLCENTKHYWPLSCHWSSWAFEEEVPGFLVHRPWAPCPQLRATCSPCYRMLALKWSFCLLIWRSWKSQKQSIAFPRWRVWTVAKFSHYIQPNLETLIRNRDFSLLSNSLKYNYTDNYNCDLDLKNQWSLPE